jgi:GLPGLI family protein
MELKYKNLKLLFISQIISTLSLVLLSLPLASQAYEITYSWNADYGSTQISTMFVQIITNEESLSLETNTEYKSVNDIIENSNIEKQYVHYSPSESSLIVNQPIFTKVFIIKEKTPLVEWEFLDERKEILGLDCQLAKVKFRGRNYSLWVTNELGVIGGVWKFVGLPGYVMAAYSDDSQISIEVTSVSESAEKVPNISILIDKNPHKIVSWTEFVEKYKFAGNNLKRSYAADSDGDIEYSFNVSQAEIIKF